MRLTPRPAGRRLFAPEIVQTSAMDCGPAALTCLLEGFGIPASYARLQEACQTDVDGTSINTIEQVALALGLDAEQIVLPADHVLLAGAGVLPALVVVRRDDTTHFLVAWRRHGPLVQLMDPAKGRRWVTHEDFRRELYVHRQSVPAAAWREWAGSEEFLGGVTERLGALGVAAQARGRFIRAAVDDPGWRQLAVLDASTRIVADLVQAGGLRRGVDSTGLIEAFVRRAGETSDPRELIPDSYWSVLPDDPRRGDEHVVLSGAVLLRVREGRRESHADPTGGASEARTHVPESLARALSAAPTHPIVHVWQLVRRHGVATPALLVAALVLVAGGTLFEILMLRGVLEIHNVLSLREQRLAATGMLLGFVGALLLVDLAIAGGVLRIGRRIETQIRAALLEKLPKVGDRYFHSRLVADMAHRAHSLDALRALPDFGASLARTSMQLILTAVGLAWLDPSSAWIAACAVILALAIPLATEPILGERELRQRSHAAALGRHYLDSLIGLVAARTHGAERALRQRHEMLLVEWGRSSLHLLRGGVVVEGAQMLIGSTLAAWLVLDFVGGGTRPGGTLLFVYWALNLPSLGRDLASTIRQYPVHRNILARVLEPLDAPEEGPVPSKAEPQNRGGVAIGFEDIHVHMSGQPVIDGVDLDIAAGEHVAIVGRSGAGKSTLVGLLLGWQPPTGGEIRVDDAPLSGEHVLALRGSTTWLDPAVYLWNRTLFDNLRYGDTTGLVPDIGSIVETAQLTNILETLPAGLQSPLGEGGRLTSGGEGQRVRFGRALVRQHVRLAILDEPFRGLDRHQRHEMLASAREVWGTATLLCVTHDISETLSFGRVLVMEAGRIVEDGDPAVLSRTPGSAFAALLAAEEGVGKDLWSDARWRRWQLRDGTLSEHPWDAETQWTQQRSRGR